LTLSKTGTTARTQTARDASGNLCLDTVNNAFTAAQTIDLGTGTLPTLTGTPGFTLAGPDDTLLVIQTDTWRTSDAGGIRFNNYRPGGTRSAPLATPAYAQMFGFGVQGHDGVSAQSIPAALYLMAAGAAWSATNRETVHLWEGVPNGSTTRETWMTLQNASAGIGISPIAGNGLIQTASGTTKANGWALSTDLFFFRLSSGFASLQTSGVAVTDRHGLSLARGGYSAPGAHLSDADGDKLVIYNGDNQHSVIGQGNTSNFWFKSTNGTTGGSFEWYTGTAGATLRLTLNATGLVGTGAVLSSSSTAGVGYSTGAGGTVTQITSRTTGVTLNKITGAITLVSAAGSVAWQSFTVTNSAVAATDTVICNQVSGTDLNMIHVTAIAAGSFRISFATTAGVTVEQPVFRFTVIKSVSA
jgi:hypothetical protein